MDFARKSTAELLKLYPVLWHRLDEVYYPLIAAYQATPFDETTHNYWCWRFHLRHKLYDWVASILVDRGVRLPDMTGSQHYTDVSQLMQYRQAHKPDGN